MFSRIFRITDQTYFPDGYWFFSRSVENGGERWHSGLARVVNRVEIDPISEIRLIRAHAIRLVTEDDSSVRIYYSVENTREFREVDEQVSRVLLATVESSTELFPFSARMRQEKRERRH